MEEYLKTEPGNILEFQGNFKPSNKNLCDVYWGSHGCHKKKHHRFNRHTCDPCEGHPWWLHWILFKIGFLAKHFGTNGCVERYPYYGKDTNFYGEDVEHYKLRTFDE